MHSIEEIFRASALAVIDGKRGVQARIAREAGVQSPYLNAILKGAKPGVDEVRRKIAAALGYPGRAYEDFLDIGRTILTGEPAKTSACTQNVDLPAGFSPENAKVSKAKFYYMLIPANIAEDCLKDYELHVELTDNINNRVEKEGGEFIGFSTLWTEEKSRPLNFMIFRYER